MLTGFITLSWFLLSIAAPLFAMAALFLSGGGRALTRGKDRSPTWRRIDWTDMVRKAPRSAFARGEIAEYLARRWFLSKGNDYSLDAVARSMRDGVFPPSLDYVMRAGYARYTGNEAKGAWPRVEYEAALARAIGELEETEGRT